MSTSDLGPAAFTELPLNPDELSRLASQLYAQASGIRTPQAAPVTAAPPLPASATPPVTTALTADIVTPRAVAGLPLGPASTSPFVGHWPGSVDAASAAATAAAAFAASAWHNPTSAFALPELGTGATPGSDLFELGGVERSGGVQTRILDDPRLFDVDSIRRDFPILAERVNGRPLVWLDNAATTQKPNQVIDRIVHFYQHENSNIHRAAHELAARATNAYEDARETVRRFLGAASTDQIIFVRGATEAINLVAFAWGNAHVGAGDEIVITNLEHHANTVPWQQLAQRTGAILRVAPVDDRGALILEELERIVGPRTKLIAAAHVSNALGTITPVDQIVEIGHRYGARVLIDGAQSVPHAPVDVSTLGADFFVFSGHKIFGPTGIGVLYGSADALAETPHWQTGGNMIADVTYERTVFQGLPNRLEAGTGNIAGAVGLGAALRYVESIGIQRIARYEHALVEYAQERLAAIPGLTVIGTAPEKASVISFVIDGLDPITIGQRLNDVGIAVRAGHHCAQPILRRFGVETTVRPSFAFYNTRDEADHLVAEVQAIAARSRTGLR